VSRFSLILPTSPSARIRDEVAGRKVNAPCEGYPETERRVGRSPSSRPRAPVRAIARDQLASAEWPRV